MNSLSKYFALFLVSLVFTSLPAIAQSYSEIGFTANFRKSSIDEGNWQQTLSYTGPFSYYFWQTSAIELSYTQGLSELSVRPPDLPNDRMLTQSYFSLIGLDLVASFADRRAPFQPYVKLGSAFINKKIYRQLTGFNSTLIAESSGLVPSAGLGFRVLMTETLSLRVGFDSWTNPLNERPLILDYAARAGVSWMF